MLIVEYTMIGMKAIFYYDFFGMQSNALRHCITVVTESPIRSTKFADTLAVLNVIRFPKSNDFCAIPFISDLVFCQMLGLFVSFPVVRPFIACCFGVADCSGASFGRAITIAAPTDNAHNNAPLLCGDVFILMRLFRSVFNFFLDVKFTLVLFASKSLLVRSRVAF